MIPFEFYEKAGDTLWGCSSNDSYIYVATKLAEDAFGLGDMDEQAFKDSLDRVQQLLVIQYGCQERQFEEIETAILLADISRRCSIDVARLHTLLNLYFEVEDASRHYDGLRWIQGLLREILREHTRG